MVRGVDLHVRSPRSCGAARSADPGKPCCDSVGLGRDWRECDHHRKTPKTVGELRGALVRAAKVAGGELPGECTFDCVIYYAGVLSSVPADATAESWVEFSS